MVIRKKRLPSLFVLLAAEMACAQFPSESIHTQISNMSNHVAAGVLDNNPVPMMPLGENDRAKLSDHHDSLEHVERLDPSVTPPPSNFGNLGLFPQPTPIGVPPMDPMPPMPPMNPMPPMPPMAPMLPTLTMADDSLQLNVTPPSLSVGGGFAVEKVVEVSSNTTFTLPTLFNLTSGAFLPTLPPPRLNNSFDLNLPLLPSIHVGISSQNVSSEDAQKFNFETNLLTNKSGTASQPSTPPLFGAAFQQSVTASLNQPGLPAIKVETASSNVFRPDEINSFSNLQSSIGNKPFAGTEADGKFGTLSNGSLDINIPFVPSLRTDFMARADGSLDSASFTLSGNVRSDILKNLSAVITPILTPTAMPSTPTPTPSTPTPTPSTPTPTRPTPTPKPSATRPTRPSSRPDDRPNDPPPPSTPPPAPLFPPALPSPLSIFGKFATGMQAVQASILDIVSTPFVSPAVSQIKRMEFITGADLVIATPFIKINAKSCIALVIVSATMCLPIVKAGSFFTIPFVRSTSERPTVPLFVVADSMNSFAMQIDVPDLKASIDAGRMMIVARTNATEKLLEPLLLALRNINPNVNDQTIVLQPIMKASTLDVNVLPSELNNVVRDVRRLLNIETLSERVSNVVDSIRATVDQATTSFSSLISNATRRDSQSGPMFNMDGQFPGNQRAWKLGSMSSTQPDIDFLDEVHYDQFGNEVFSSSRGKRGTSSSGLNFESLGDAEDMVPKMAKANLNDKENSTTEVGEKLAECGAHLLEMVTTECHRIETYELQSCSTDSPECKLIAQNDLAKLMDICNNPTPALMCNMSTTQKKGVVDEKGMPKSMKHTIYTFSIVRIFNPSPACQINLRCVIEKQFGCRA